MSHYRAPRSRTTEFSLPTWSLVRNRGGRALVSVALGLVPPATPAVAQASPSPQAYLEWTLDSLTLISPRTGRGAVNSMGWVRVAPDGRVFVVDQAENRLMVYAPDGSSVRTIGRKGEGPGEFLSLSSLGFLGDTLWVVDRNQRRISFFSSAGRLLSTMRLERRYPAIRHDNFSLQAILRDGTGYFYPVIRLPDDPDHTGYVVPFLLAAPGSQRVDTVLTADMSHSQAPLLARGGWVGTTFQPFQDYPLVGGSVSGNAFVVIHREAAGQPGPSAFTIRFLRSDVSAGRELRIPYTARPIPSTLVDSLLWRYAGSLTPAYFPTQREALGVLRRRVFLPRVFPPVSNAMLGIDGTIWLRREGVTEQLSSESALWQCYNAAGTLLGQVHLPPDNYVVGARRGALWVMSLDADDVPEIVRWTLRAR